jgi:cell division protein FtsI (penicillin-binding protein 3)
VVSERTASEIMEMMGDAVEYGTARAAAVPGYEVAGKTGTAWQICPETSTYWCPDGQRHYTASFIGIVSNDTGPVLTITVIIDGSRGVNYAGGSAAAPVFAELAGYTLRQLRIPPSSQTAAPSERIRAEAAVGPVETGEGA